MFAQYMDLRNATKGLSDIIVELTHTNNINMGLYERLNATTLSECFLQNRSM